MVGCVSFPTTFEGSHWPDSTISHKKSQVEFPAGVIGFKRENKAIVEYGSEGNNFSVGYQQPKYYDGLAQRVTVYIYQEKAELNRLINSAQEEIKADRLKEKLLLKDFHAASYPFKNALNSFHGQRVSFVSQVRAWDSLVVASVLKTYDTYEELWMFKGKNWVIKIRMTGLLHERANLATKFETFVKAFLEQQKMII